VYGRENIPRYGGFILASNHASYLDPIVLGVVSPRKMNFMAKEELFYQKWFARFLTALGVFPVKRGSADLSAIKEAMRRIREGKGLVLFPEGSRRFDNNSGQLYRGIGFLALKVNAPIVPAFIRGSNLALPRKAKFIRLHSISVSFGSQFQAQSKMPYEEVARLTIDKIKSLQENF
jgi:1-acyl-sn-glycerol-3-phosphate acyltransferase